MQLSGTCHQGLSTVSDAGLPLKRGEATEEGSPCLLPFLLSPSLRQSGNFQSNLGSPSSPRCLCETQPCSDVASHHQPPKSSACARRQPPPRPPPPGSPLLHPSSLEQPQFQAGGQRRDPGSHNRRRTCPLCVRAAGWEGNGPHPAPPGGTDMCRERPEAAEVAKARRGPGPPAMAGAPPARAGTARCPVLAGGGQTGQPCATPRPPRSPSLPSAKPSASANCLFSSSSRFTPSSFFFCPPPFLPFFFLG